MIIYLCKIFYKKIELIFTIYLLIKLDIVDSSCRLVSAVELKAKLMQCYHFMAYFTNLSVPLHTTRDRILK